MTVQRKDGSDPAPELVALAYLKMREHFEEVPDDIAKTVRHCKVGKNESVDWDFLSRQSSQSTGVDSLL